MQRRPAPSLRRSPRSTGRLRLVAALAAVPLLALSACAGDDLADDDEPDAADSADETTAPSGEQDRGPVTIASQNFGEAQLVTAMYDLLLTEAGFDTEVQLVAARDAYMATFPDTVDVVPEYVGGIVNFLNAQAGGADAEPFTAGDGEELAEQGAELLEKQGITLLDLSSAADANAFFVTAERAEADGLETLSDLEGESVVLAAAPDCEGRLDCEGGLSEQYGIDVTEVLPLGYASDQTYRAVLDGEADLGETSTTDGTLEAQGLVVLDDDQQVQPAQNLVPAVSTRFLEQHPEVADVLNPLMAALTTDNLTELNSRISVDREKPEDVAADFLAEEGLL
ncbi:ABC transporter substrate-binding protein [Nocardioides ferulae]|uniref:ABC transporter substrate-binding protein n=1 Tax=Nocardioides ferulae TaxID=2340821 RepID=UPI000EAF212B|nr:ABC transporter substrate-binding protein [Nocardioides ferulae]